MAWAHPASRRASPRPPRAPAFGGTTFADTHEHYNSYAGGAFTKAMFTDARDELREHGHTAPFVFFIGPADRASVVGLSGLV
jgi:hypothetical protein